MGKQTPLYQAHVDQGGKMVDFAGWDMPLHYGSQIQEHHHVRRTAGMFDVSHMTVVDLAGARVFEFLGYLLSNNPEPARAAGKAFYSCMLNEQGGVIDDLITYPLSADLARLIVNAATRAKDLAWIQQQAASFDVEVIERAELSMIAVQGPQARASVAQILSPEERTLAMALGRFQAVQAGAYFIARTGYTGEDGFELLLTNTEAQALWQALLAVEVKPCGLGARDTLRLEAGMHLYGSDMDEHTSPLETGLGWTIAWQPETRNFIGKEALQAQKATPLKQKLVGLVLEGKGIIRNHQKVFNAQDQAGEVSSGGFSPTLGQSIALARVPADTENEVRLELRGKQRLAKIVKIPFVRNGKSCL